MSSAAISMEAKKVELIAQITRIIDYDVLLELEKFLYSFEHDTEHWKKLSKQDRQKLEKGLQDIKKGKVLSHSAVKKKIDKYIQEL